MTDMGSAWNLSSYMLGVRVRKAQDNPAERSNDRSEHVCTDIAPFDKSRGKKQLIEFLGDAEKTTKPYGRAKATGPTPSPGPS